MQSAPKLKALRALLKKHKLAGFLQPVHDEYMSEYPPVCNRRVEWLSGFSGSAGAVVITLDRAVLFTDGRYTLQARAQTDNKLFDYYNTGETLPETWLAEHAGKGKRIGYDAKLYSMSAMRRMTSVCGAKGVELVPIENLVDAIWKDRPAAPASAVFIHELKYSGESPASKRQIFAPLFEGEGRVDAVILTLPDSINWLFNIRGHDVENTPLALMSAIVQKNKVMLFADAKRFSKAVKAHLGTDVKLAEPAALEKALQALGKKRVQCDGASLPVWYSQVLRKAGATIIEGKDPCTLPKACKNPVELQGMRNAHLRDGVAVSKLLCWLDEQTNKRKVYETEVCDKLLSLRQEQSLFVEPSFPTISGSGPNGAIVHYRVTEESNRALKSGELFLLDSGGQYFDGTTDITRTVAIGKPSAEQKENFTRVLKGHIAVATARFPRGTSGSQLDVLARNALWEAGLDYDHGTGHGVGCFLGVHEGPQRISKRGGDAELCARMIVSNEPGYYKAGAYGIRIENLVAVKDEKAGEGGRKFLGFETITCVPIDTRLVNGAMLVAGEKRWLNVYHAWVYKQLSPKLSASERAWLKQRCAAL